MQRNGIRVSRGTYRRWKENVATQPHHLHTSANEGSEVCKSKPTDIISFDDPREAYKSKTMAELVRAICVFRMCGIKTLVKNSNTILNESSKVLGKRTVDYLVKRSFFGHFCAGETIEEVEPVVKHLGESGVGAILDFAAENDVPQEERLHETQGASIERLDDILVSRQRAEVHSARIYDYMGEKECDNNLQTVLTCIQHTAGIQSNPFCAVKLTALCKPALLERMSALLMAIRRSWVEGFASEHIIKSTPLEEYRTIVSSPGIRKPINLKQWKQGLARICKIPVEDEDAERMFEALSNNKGCIDYLDYTRYVTLEALSFQKDVIGTETWDQPSSVLRPLTHSGALPLLTEKETELLGNLVTRVNAFAQCAVEHDVACMIDAEQTYLQVAIDHFVILLQRVYNLEKPIIYNTYQCYLDYSKIRVLNDLERCKREGWKFAGKFVRGAYMIQEREIALKKGYASPIRPDIEATHTNFNEVMDLVLDEVTNRKMGIMIGSHNKESIKRIITKMKENNIDKKTGGIYFGQLLGMADNLTFPLGQHGYNVYKYVPYGPVHEVMPYLVRRAQENSAVADQSTHEARLLLSEVKRRMSPAKA
eukprot:TRINITY_DN9203_c0_g1_i1.p1 TRINITY_DN9203_c0_g1~~TRINITY_DN9203_c0_g1_i1.p1  ORF type:complete len:595 (+),score=105.91 TRINITY_DN9203_c0_g1_i1:71-1855(+)